jgi:hypothetical protein
MKDYKYFDFTNLIQVENKANNLAKNGYQVDVQAYLSSAGETHYLISARKEI